MQTKIRFITMNGPLCVGKSWVGDQLEKYLKVNHPSTRLIRADFKDVLAAGVQRLLGVEHMDYAKFKLTEFYGLTGRQWLIRASEEMMKPVDPMIFSKILYDKMKVEFGIRKNTIAHSRQSLLFYADSNGFEDELMFFRGREDLDLLACSIEPEDFIDRRGQPWIDGDSRYNLAHLCNVVAPTSTIMFENLIKALDRRNWI